MLLPEESKFMMNPDPVVPSCLEDYKGMSGNTINAIVSGQVKVAVQMHYNITSKKFMAGIFILDILERCTESFETMGAAERYAEGLRQQLESRDVRLLNIGD